MDMFVYTQFFKNLFSKSKFRHKKAKLKVGCLTTAVFEVHTSRCS